MKKRIINAVKWTLPGTVVITLAVGWVYLHFTDYNPSREGVVKFFLAMVILFIFATLWHILDYLAEDHLKNKDKPPNEKKSVWELLRGESDEKDRQ